MSESPTVASAARVEPAAVHLQQAPEHTPEAAAATSAANLHDVQTAAEAENDRATEAEKPAEALKAGKPIDPAGTEFLGHAHTAPDDASLTPDAGAPVSKGATTAAPVVTAEHLATAYNRPVAFPGYPKMRYHPTLPPTLVADPNADAMLPDAATWRDTPEEAVMSRTYSEAMLAQSLREQAALAAHNDLVEALPKPTG